MITCWFFRTSVSAHLDATPTLTDWAQRHVQGCARCRQFYESSLKTVAELSAGAENEKRLPSPFLHGRIMSTIRAEKTAGTAIRLPREPMGWKIALATACVLLFVGSVWMRRPTTTGQKASGLPVSSGELSFNVNLPSPAQVDQWTKALDEPLENETQLILSDAKAAINSLKSSFLPEQDIGLSPLGN